MFALVRAQALRIPQPQPPAPLQFGASLLLGATHLLDRFVQQLHHMEAVERDLGGRERLPRSLHVGRRHVHAQLPDSVSASPVGFEVRPELPQHPRFPPRGRVQQPPLVQVREEGDAAVAPAACLLVHSDRLHAAMIRRHPRFVHMVLDDPPEPGVVLPDDASHRPHRHLRRHRHHERLEEQGEPAPRTSPRHPSASDPARRTLHPRRRRVQEGLVLEEVQVPPPLPGRVVRLAAPVTAATALEHPSSLEVQVQIELPRLRVELGLLHVPGMLEPQRLLEQFRPLHSDSLPPAPLGRLPAEPGIGRRGSAGIRSSRPGPPRPIFRHRSRAESPSAPSTPSSPPSGSTRSRGAVNGVVHGVRRWSPQASAARQQRWQPTNPHPFGTARSPFSRPETPLFRPQYHPELLSRLRYRLRECFKPPVYAQPGGSRISRMT